MTTSTIRHRALAIASGAMFTAGGLIILLGDVIATPSSWTTYHALTILTVAGTIAAGHLAGTAWHAKSHLAAAGFVVLFLTGTGLVVYQSVGRQAETTDARALSIEARNGEIESKRADLGTTRQRLADAERMVQIETGKKHCGRACKDWKTRAAEVRSHIRALETDLAGLGAPAPVAPKAEKMAAVAALFGADPAKAKAALMLLEPFLWTLFFEIGSVVSLGFAFRRNAVTAADRMQTSFAATAPIELFTGEQPDPPSPPKPRKRQPANVVRFRRPSLARGEAAEPVARDTMARIVRK